MGFGRWAAKEVAKKVAGKTVKHTTLRKGVDIKQFISPKKGALKKFKAALNREAGKAIQEASSGVSLKYKKSGMPHVPKGTKPSILTKAKGWGKIAGVAGGAKVGLAGLPKDKKKEKK